MPRNGSGTFNRLYSWEDDAANNIKIRADRMDAEMDGMATALSNSIAVDGQTPITANLPMSGFKHTGVADAVARDDYAAAGQVQDSAFAWGGTDSGTADAYAITLSPAITAYAAGQKFRFIVGTGNTNTGACTLAVNGLTATSIKLPTGGDPDAGVLSEGRTVDATYDGTNFILNSEQTQVITPRIATDGGTDAFAFDAGMDVADGQVVIVTIPAANTTASPTGENTGGTPSGAQSIVTTEGVAFINMLEARPHRFQWDNGNTQWVVLDPAGGVVEKGSGANGDYTVWEDGRAECSISADATFNATSNLSYTWSFPVTFSGTGDELAFSFSADIVNSSISTNLDSVGPQYMNSPSTTSVQYRIYRVRGEADFASGDTIPIRLVAKGVKA